MKERIKYLDYSKGFAMILVMFCHYFLNYSNQLRQWCYSFHLPVFFIITGMLINYKNSKLNVKKLLKKLIKPYFVLSTFNIVFLFIYDILCNNKYVENIITNVKYVLCFNGLKATWFLPVLFLAYLLFYFINDNVKDEKNKVVIYILLFLFPFIKLNITSYYTYKIICRTFIATTYMFVGYSCFKKIDNVSNKIIYIIGLFILTLVFTYYLGYIDLKAIKLKDPYLYFTSSIIGSCFTILLFKYIESKKIKLRLLTFIGKNSLIFLGTHMVIGYYVKKILQLLMQQKILFNNELLQAFLILIIVIIIEIPTVYIFNKFIFKEEK